MRKWKFYSIATLFVLLILLETSHSEVTLRVLLRPPMVTLECLVVKVVEKLSVILMCPNDVMCFKNCKILCIKNCSANAIKCSMSNTETGFKYTYTFDTTDAHNQGEWTCHFGNQQSSTVIFFNNTDENLATKVGISQESSTLRSRTTTFHRSISNISPLATKIIRGPAHGPRVHIYVLIFLLVFSICLNIGLIVRNVRYKISNKKSNAERTTNRKSCFYELCNKIFCVGEYSRGKETLKTESKEFLPRQISNNIYECTPSSHLPPAIILDNYAFIGTPTNQRWGPSNSYEKSLSFTSKPTDKCMGGGTRPTTLLTNTPSKYNLRQMFKVQDTTNPVIYDDVPEQSICYNPMNYFTMNNRPSQYLSMSTSMDGRIPVSAMSMNNLASTGYRLSDIASSDEHFNDDSLLKDAITSRVELSKEMIHQADSLLKRADSLLNDKETQPNGHG